MEKNKIKTNIYSVGVVDENVRIFHGYQTPFGTTYNSYLIVDEKVVLVDFVKAKFSSQLLDNISTILGDRQIDYIICNHVEPDHSGALPDVVLKYPNAVIYGTVAAERELKIYYPSSVYKFIAVRANDTLTSGQYTFNFIPMPMVHWPDSMSTFLAEANILFSNDAFGQHIGTGAMWDTDLNLDQLLERVADYYANIVMPFGAQVLKLVDAISSLKIDLVCPSHGVILKSHIAEVFQKYISYANNETDSKKAVIVFDTMWGTTTKLATKLAASFASDGIACELINLSEHHYSYAMSRLIDAKYVFVGSPTLNNTMLPSVSAFLTYLKGLRPKNRIGKAFGSYGWSGESIKQIEEILLAMNWEVSAPEKVMWNI
ncbi:MAG: FprA family A-type flavoprotein [Clostridia bacterium]